MPAEAIRINRRVLLQCSIGAPGLKQPFAQPQQNGALSAFLPLDDGWWLHLRRTSAPSIARAAWDRREARRFRDFANVANCALLTSELSAASPWLSEAFEGPLSGDRTRLQQRYRCTLHECRIRADCSHRPLVCSPLVIVYTTTVRLHFEMAPVAQCCRLMTDRIRRALHCLHALKNLTSL